MQSLIKDKDYYIFDTCSNLDYVHIVSFKNNHYKFYGNERKRNYNYIRQFKPIEFEVSVPSNKKGLLIITKNSKYYLVNGIYHRDEGPALISKDGGKIYFKHGKQHRLEGPAVVFTFNKLNYQYMINGKEIHKEKAKFPLFNNGKIINNVRLDRQAIVEAMLFDREYGKFLLTVEKYISLNISEKLKIAKNYNKIIKEKKIRQEKSSFIKARNSSEFLQFIAIATK